VVFFSIILYIWSFVNEPYALKLYDKKFISVRNIQFQDFFKFYCFFKKNNYYFNLFFDNVFYLFNIKNKFLSFFFIFFYIFKNFFMGFVRTYQISSFYFFVFFDFNKINFLKLNLLNNKHINYANISFIISNRTIQNFSVKSSYVFWLHNYLMSFENFNINSNYLIKIKSSLSSFFIRINNSFLMKFLKNNNLNGYIFFYLRKSRVFNKGRYSRNRQNFRTGVYWCLYVNILAVLGIYYFFYKFTINFGYLWWIFIFFINCFFFNKFIKLHIFSIQGLIIFFKKLFFWYIFLFKI
jgi:hypothetical protein